MRVSDKTLHARFGLDPRARDLSITDLAAKLAHLSVAAKRASEHSSLSQVVRPEGGARDLIEAVTASLAAAGVDVTCRFDPESETYTGGFVRIAAWLIRIGVQETESTLCQYCVKHLASKRNKPRET